MKTTLPLIASILTITGSAVAGNVRVAHLSPDAPAVDVRVNGAVAFQNLSFNEVSDYADLPAGDYQIQVVPTGASEPVVIDTVLSVPAKGDFTAAALNPLAEIGLGLFEDDNRRIPGSTRVRFVHASPGTPAVDIALAGGAVLFPNVAYGESGGYIEVPAGIYDLEARVAGTDTVALSLPGTELSGGTGITVWASGLLNAEPALGVALSVDVAPFAKVRILHASPDAPMVDCIVNGSRAITELSFLEDTGYVALDTGSTNVKVVPTGSSDPVVINSTLDLGAEDYSVLAVGELANIRALPLVDDNSLSDDARIRFIHASPDAPAVDIALANGGPVLFANVSFGDSGGYIEVPGGTYDLEARVAGTDTVALSVPGVNVTGNRVFTIVATGFLSGSPSLGALPLLDAEACRTDVNGDARTNVDDLLGVLTNWSSNDPWGDINGSGTVEVMDLMAVIQSFGVCKSDM